MTENKIIPETSEIKPLTEDQLGEEPGRIQRGDRILHDGDGEGLNKHVHITEY